ncbi:hypothetical protein [Actinomadura sp. KC216]|uniref:hypothetical protein n=1 Tax=Actinomadura sp. KC216 TaxID=2530370 RepID=UPI001A9F6754|nr:hypothetical protein [Actinomadura sp. KC216]
MGGTDVEHVAGYRHQFAIRLQAVLDQQHEAYKVLHPGVGAVAVVSGERVELLREVLPPVDSFDLPRGNVRERKDARELDLFGGGEFLRSLAHIQPDRGIELVGQVPFSREPPSRAARRVRLEFLRRSHSKDESVAVDIL